MRSSSTGVVEYPVFGFAFFPENCNCNDFSKSVIIPYYISLHHCTDAEEAGKGE